MKNPLFYLLITLYALTACSNGEDYREPKSEEDLSGLVLAASNGSYYQQKYEKRADVQLFLTSSEADGVQAVRQGHADVYVSDEVMLTKEDLKRLGMKKAFVGEECFDVAFAIRKGNTEMAAQLNAFLASAPLEDITNYWINGGTYVEEPAYTIPEGAKPLYCVCGVNLAPISYVGEGGKWQGYIPSADPLRCSLWTSARLSWQSTPARRMCSPAVFLSRRNARNRWISLPLTINATRAISSWTTPVKHVWGWVSAST